ncbi:hypothetical protein GCM10011409_06950 [Lentibacillus populi]|uniref:GW domain-containing protein n=1 Tax=Lentibacillus populi TaxID=1827502 RepID=A0A9W5TV91_9BACI|nr:GW dipeptide domain-containing protein [Lentibacillus populi]GGB32172.1 hypothetical protein GCM10011409_06950 [Lentibacillus populi]
MRKTAIFLIACLIFNLLLSYSLPAAAAPISNVNEQQVENVISDQEKSKENNNETIIKEETENDSEQKINDDTPIDAEDGTKEETENESSSLSGSELDNKTNDSKEDDEGKKDSSVSDPEKEVDSSDKGDNSEQHADIQSKKARSLTTSSANIGVKTSRLGHIRSTSVRIYDIPGSDVSFAAGDKYTNAVYYIKKQADIDGTRYYLISEEPGSVNGVVGWVKATDLSTHEHLGLDKQDKTFYFSGKGSAYSKAWGGSKDLVYQDMSKYKGQKFNVHLTEKVGNNTWYRGNFNGKTIWLHESYVTKKQSSNIVRSHTSKLGHIRSTGVKIYKTIGDSSTAFTAGSKYTNQVYYIKQQAMAGGQTYYLISLKPSRIDGVVGWVKENDLSLHAHHGVDKKNKTLYFTGKGSAYTKAWGGSKDLVYQDMSKYKGQQFNIHLTETVGNNTWYRGNFNGKTIWLHESYLTSKSESNTSKLGHIRNTKVKIYKTIGKSSTAFTAGEKYTNQVYYIKQQAKVSRQTYYLISLAPSRVDGVVGWVKATDLSTHEHSGLDKQDKIFYFTGKGSAYTKAWGGSKDLVYRDMSKYKGQRFSVHLTETVGNNVWYRGQFNGKTIWLHESYLTKEEESHTSRLGHLHSSAKIYKTLGDESSNLKTSNYTNAVYYIKQQAKINDQIYYLISKKPSRVDGVVGWVKSSDMSTHEHVGVDSKDKLFKIIGTGSAYSKAWGGSKDLVYADVSKFKGQEIKVNLTEKVGNNIWYRGTLDGKTVWFHESYLKKTKEVITNYTTYELTLDKMLELQMKVNPQTDKQYKLWIREDAFGSIRNGKGTIKGDNWNLRRGPGTNYLSGGKVNNGKELTLIASQKVSGFTWYHVGYTSGWVTPDVSDVRYYLDYRNFMDSLKNKLQFLKLSESANVSVTEVNEKILKGKGILEGKAQSFIDGGQKYNVNEIYLISHALLETGNGTSKLAKGVKYNGKTVYNMYGINANDKCPVECGAKYAFDHKWFTPEAAIVGGATFVNENYVQAGQDTLYKMRWNPLAAAKYGYATHQYATDIGWAYKQTSRMYELYNLLNGYNLILDIPKYL